MRNSIIFLLLFLSCKERVNKNNIPLINILKIKLSDKLPFKSVKLQNYDPLYGSILPFNYQVIKEKDSIVFKFNMSETGFVHLTDENDIGVIDIFLKPGENFGAEIYWNKHEPIKMNIVSKQWPGDNILYQSIHDSVDALYEKIKNCSENFDQRSVINQYVETLFAQTVTPALIQNSSLKTSRLFNNHVMQPQFELIKCYCKNKLITKSGHQGKWKKFYADSVFSNPDYKFWCERYLEDGYFDDYLFGAINNSNANDLREYIQNIEKFYRVKGDTLLTKIAVSRGLKSFSEKFSSNADNTLLPIILDSICKVFNLDVRKYNFPNFSVEKLPKLDLRLFDKIILGSLTSETQLNLHKVINDTSKVYYIDYWASWCKPCIEALPYTIALYKKNLPKLGVLFFSIDKVRNNFLAAANKLKLPLSQTYNVVTNCETSNDYNKLHPINYIPVYQLVFFYKGSWRIMSAVSSEDPSINSQIENLINLLRNNN